MSDSESMEPGRMNRLGWWFSGSLRPSAPSRSSSSPSRSLMSSMHRRKSVSSTCSSRIAPSSCSSFSCSASTPSDLGAPKDQPDQVWAIEKSMPITQDTLQEYAPVKRSISLASIRTLSRASISAKVESFDTESVPTTSDPIEMPALPGPRKMEIINCVCPKKPVIYQRPYSTATSVDCPKCKRDRECEESTKSDSLYSRKYRYRWLWDPHKSKYALYVEDRSEQEEHLADRLEAAHSNKTLQSTFEDRIDSPEKCFSLLCSKPDLRDKTSESVLTLDKCSAKPNPPARQPSSSPLSEDLNAPIDAPSSTNGRSKGLHSYIDGIPARMKGSVSRGYSNMKRVKGGPQSSKKAFWKRFRQVSTPLRSFRRRSAT